MRSTSRMFNSIKMFKALFCGRILLLGFTTAVFTGQALAQEGTWETKPSLPGVSGIRNPVVAGGNGLLYAVGGTDNVCGAYSTLETYDPLTNTWTTEASMPTARWGLSAAVINGVLYAVGGLNGCGAPSLGTVEAYNPATNTWTTKASMPTARSSFSVGVVNGILYAVGGGNDTLLATLEAYDPVTNTWTTKASMPTARYASGVGVVNGILYAVGGTNGATSLATVEAYDPATDTWTTKAPMPAERLQLAVEVVNGILYAVGGNVTANNIIVATLEAYDPVTNTWTTEAPMPTARAALSAGVVNGILYAVGGSNASGVLATNEAFTPEVTQITVAIDIKPGSFRNRINPRSRGKIPVAILTTDTFDATTVDPTTVLFGATGTEAVPVRSALRDVDEDGDTDRILRFNTRATGIQCGDTSASLTGVTLDGQMIQGSDAINTVRCK